MSDDENQTTHFPNIDNEDDDSVQKLDAVRINLDDECINSDDDDDAIQHKDCPPHFPSELKAYRGSRLLELVYCANECNRKLYDKVHRRKEYVVAKKVTLINEDGSIQFEQVLDALTSKQLRWFTKQCGCKDGGSLNKFDARVLIAETKSSKAKYDKKDEDKIDGFNKIICNNFLRVINAVFFDDLNYTMFLKTNDRKDRKDIEGTDGGNGAKNELFWAEVASSCNNPYGDFNCDFVQPAVLNKDYEKHLKKAKLLGFSPGYCGSVFHPLSCMKLINNLIKIRAKMLAKMSESGTHESDAYTYTVKSIQDCSMVRTIHMFVAYYFYICCNERDGVVEAITRLLPDDVKCDSSTVMKKKVRGGGSTKSPKLISDGLATLVASVKVSSDRIDDHLTQSFILERKKYKDAAAKEHLDLVFRLDANPRP